MKLVRSILRDAIALAAVALLIGITANAVRAKNSITLSRNYFDKGLRAAEKPPGDDAPHPGRTSGSNGAGDVSPPAAKVPAVVSAASGDEEKHLEHPYQELKFDRIKAIIEGADPETGAYLFVDARNDHLYEEGHIPGAVQCDHYRLNDYIDDVLPPARQVEKVIVYCNGGDCEDSIFMCGDLVENDIPFERVYLYPGGWKQWVKNGMPVVKGKEPGSPAVAVEPISAGDRE